MSCSIFLVECMIIGIMRMVRVIELVMFMWMFGLKIRVNMV